MLAIQAGDDQNGRVLVVDDDESLVKLLTDILHRAGFRNVLGISDPFQARDLYQIYNPDAVVLDLSMPGLSGEELMQTWTELEPDGYAPILVLTGMNDPSERVRALTAGARDFLAKPFLPVEVVARVRNMLQIRRLYVRTEHERETLEQEVLRRSGEIIRAHHEILKRLGLACEYRDDDTGHHTRRLGEYAGIVASRLGLDPEECELVRLASPLHDIGKVGIPDSILLKPGKLEPEEFEVIKTHTLIGAAILSGSDVPLLQAAEVIARTHHEKWDGNGYPARLSGEAIPLHGRIVAVCDVFDALVSPRPYKAAWPVEEAVAELERCRGKHFDSMVVDAFMSSLPALIEIRASLS